MSFSISRPRTAGKSFTRNVRSGMKCPAELYVTSTRAYHDRDVVVTACGRLCLDRKRINISTVLAGQKPGVKEVDEGIWLASFMHYDLGYFDLEQKTLQPPRQPVRHDPCLRSVPLPMSPGRTVESLNFPLGLPTYIAKFKESAANGYSGFKLN